MKKTNPMQRLRASNAKPQDLVLGVAWYDEEQWARVKASAVDPERFEATYAEWVRMAEDALSDVRRAVAHPVKVHLDADELAAWCLAHGKRNDAAARAVFASLKLRERDGAG